MLPLDGVRVIEFCNVAAGPFCGMLLADMGADVIKVEHPDGGDTMRAWPPITEGYSENFASLNRNKRSVTLDLKQPEDRQRARALVLDADVLIENNRPGVMSRLGLGYEALQRDKPSLVYCSISAFGQEGPRSGEGGFDLTMQAMSGIMSVTGEPGGAPVKCGVPRVRLLRGTVCGVRDRCSVDARTKWRRGRVHRRFDARRVARYRRAADQRVLRHRTRSRKTGQRASAQRALPGIPGEGWLLRDGCRQ